jgi:NADH-quinone oxidoreductase subunit M
MIFSALGAYAMLMAIVLSYAFTGSMTIDALVVGFTSMPHMYQIMIPILLLTGFGVKAAMMPLHVWAPGAYSNAPMAFTGVFSGALSKMGVYGMVLVFVTLIPHLPEASLLRTIFAWLGGITAAMATVWAVLQDDAKKLLAYSSVAQLGYIIVGVTVGTPLAMMAALFLAVMHALFKGTLFFAAGAVERQAGTTDMTKVTGLIRKMPWTFLASLISIIALAGIPPLGGFVGKWFLYESLITGSNYLLVIVIFFSSTAAFLYAYRFLFGLFLGQEEEEYAHVKEAPLLMVLPMLILAGGSVFLGAFPGYLFKIIENGLISINYPIPTVKWWEMSTILNGWGDSVNLMYVWYSVVVVFVFFLLYIILKGRKNTRYVSTKEISTSGEIPRPHESLNFKLDFYKPFERAIEPMLRGNMDKYWTSFGKGLEAFFDFTRRLYSGNGQTYAIYVITFLVILLLFGRSWFGL